MKHSLSRRFLGLDLTDPYAKSPRPVDVAIVELDGRCAFTALPAFSIHARRAPERVDRESREPATSAVAEWLAPVSGGPDSGDILIIDGPLALASRGKSMRAAERILATAGKTPDRLDADFSLGSRARSRPFAGFVRGSVELANALYEAGWRPSFTPSPRIDGPSPNATMFEAYPGAGWTALAGKRLLKKSTAEGRSARARLLREQGLLFAESAPTHDQLDAAFCAWLGWTLFHCRERVQLIGPPCFTRRGVFCEGGILHLEQRNRLTPAGAASPRGGENQGAEKRKAPARN